MGPSESDLKLGNEPLRFRNVSGGEGKPLGGLENDSFDIPETGVEPPGGLPGSGGITFDTWERTVAFLQRFGGDLASGKPPGGLENFDIPETGVEPLGASGECQCGNQTAPTATYDT